MLPDRSIDAILNAAQKFPAEVTVENEKVYAFRTEYYLDRPEPGMVVDVRSRDAENLMDDLAIGFSRVRQLKGSITFARLNHVMFPPKADSEYGSELQIVDKVLNKGRTIAGLVSDQRFGDLSKIPAPDLSSLPEAPVMLSGPLQLHVATTWINGQDEKGPDEWCGVPGAARTPALESFSISGVTLPPDHTLEYQAHLGDIGDSAIAFGGWTKQGSSTPRGQIQGIFVRIVGNAASFYSVEYAVGAANGEQFSGHDGDIAGTRGNYLIVNRMRVSVRLN